MVKPLTNFVLDVLQTNMFSGTLSAPLPDLRDNSLRQLTFSYNNFTGLDLWGSHLSDLELSWNTALFGTLDDFFTDLPSLQNLVTRFGSFLTVRTLHGSMMRDENDLWQYLIVADSSAV